MKHKQKQKTAAAQLDLFATETPQQVTAPAPRSEVTRELLLAAKERFLALGRRFGFPQLKFTDPRTTFTAVSPRTGIGHGESAWNEVIAAQEWGWIIAFTAWLGKGEAAGAHTWHEIREAREDMLLMYAKKRGYPVYPAGNLYIAGSEDAWKAAARALDLDRLEETITRLAEVKYGPEDITAMRVWLLDWGKRNNYPAFGFPFAKDVTTDRRYDALNYGEEAWKRDTRYPYGKFQQFERYPGEWLEKCIEQCKRFDSREESIPWQLTRMKDELKKQGKGKVVEENHSERNATEGIRPRRCNESCLSDEIDRNI
jgi:hypothetical protein